MTQHRIPYQACPLCGAAEIQQVLTADASAHPLLAQAGPGFPRQITWCACRACNHVFTEGYFTPEAFGLLMQGANQGQIVGQDYERQRLVAARMIDKVLPLVDRGRWLDVGFGNAALLMTAQEYGFVPVGCDTRQASVEALRAFGFEAYAQELSQLQLAQPADVISLADVLEHMPFPKEGLAAVRERLAPGGVMLISMPNSESAVWRILNRTNTNPYWGEVEHYHNFSRSRLYALLQECGFEPVRYGVSERYRACMEVIARKS